MELVVIPDFIKEVNKNIPIFFELAPTLYNKKEITNFCKFLDKTYNNFIFYQDTKKKFVKDENEIVVTTHVTSPFLKLNTIKKAAKKLKYYDSVHSVTKEYNFACVEKSKQKLIPVNFNPKVITKTQNLNPIVQSNGAFFIFKKKTFMRYNNRIGKKPFYYELNFPESVEIDTIEDLNLARKICK